MSGSSGRGDEPPVVLLVDDERAARAAYSRVFHRARFETIEAENGAAALEVLQCRSVDAIVLDQEMPGLTGMELVAKLRSLPLHDRTPVLFVSGEGGSEIRIRALRAGASDFMVKPVVLAELVARVDAQLRMSEKWQTAVRRLSRRAETIAAIVDISEGVDPTTTAKELCQRISRGQEGAPVGLYTYRNAEETVCLASIGEQPSFMTTSDPAAISWLQRQMRGAPWVEPESAGVSEVRLGIWWACAPLRRGMAPLGVFILGGWPATGDVGALDQLQAAAVDFAAVCTLRLGSGITDARDFQERRQSMQRILSDREFWPVFQPIIDMRDGQLSGYEALTRFRDGVAPDRRLGEAAEVGLAADMELAMVAEALQKSEGLRGDMWISINVSPSVLIERNEELVALTSESPHPLVVELTEHNPIQDYEVARKALLQLGSDVRLSVDDAGAGFASLRHVIDLHPHFLKLDRSWVTGIERDDARQALVAGLVGFATRTGTDMIAEGIETPAEKSALVDLEVPYGQGYLLGRPQPLADLQQRP